MRHDLKRTFGEMDQECVGKRPEGRHFRPQIKIEIGQEGPLAERQTERQDTEKQIEGLALFELTNPHAEKAFCFSTVLGMVAVR